MEEHVAHITENIYSSTVCNDDGVELKQTTDLTTDNCSNSRIDYAQATATTGTSWSNVEADFEQTTATTDRYNSNAEELAQMLHNIPVGSTNQRYEDDDSGASTIIEDYCEMTESQSYVDDNSHRLNLLNRGSAEAGDCVGVDKNCDNAKSVEVCKLPTRRERNGEVVENHSGGGSLKITIEASNKRKDNANDVTDTKFGVSSPQTRTKNGPKGSIGKLDSTNTGEHLKSDKSTRRPRGRPRKNLSHGHVRENHDKLYSANTSACNELDDFAIKQETAEEIGHIESLIKEEPNFGNFFNMVQKLDRENGRRGRGRPRGRPRIQRNLNSGTRYVGASEYRVGLNSDNCQGESPVKDEPGDSADGINRESRFAGFAERCRGGGRGRGRPRGGHRTMRGGRGRGSDSDHRELIRSDDVTSIDGNCLKRNEPDGAASSVSKASRRGMKTGISANLKTFQCTHCLKQLKSQMSLNQHLKCVHGADPSPPQPSLWFFQRQCHAVADAVAALSGISEISSAKVFDDADCKEHSVEEPKENAPNSKLQIQCQICDQVFKTYYQLLVHSRSHTGEDVHQCEICDLQFIARGHLVQHYKTHNLHVFEKSGSETQCIDLEKISDDHDGENVFSVFPDLNLSDLNLEGAEAISLESSSNNGESTRNDSLRADRKVDDADKMVGIEEQIAIAEYEEAHYGVRRYRSVRKMLSKRPASKNKNSIGCPVCGKAFTTKYSLVIHSRIHTGEKPYACDICNLRFYTNGHLVSHRRTHTGEKPYKCKDCGRSFSASNPLRRHELSFHSTLRPYVCEFCAFTFKFKDHLRLHIMRRHCDRKQVKCKFCDMMFTDRKLANRHERCKHRLKSDGVEETSERKFKCRLCDEVFESTALVKQHKADVHANETQLKPTQLHMCPICDKTYSWRAGLRAHLAVHSGERRFECSVCNKKFFHLNILRRHSVTHSEARPFSCRVCGRRFKSKGVMVKHETRFHFGEKQFSCELCGNQFFTATELKTHKSFVHTDEKTFVCEICDARVKTHMSLKQHMLCHGEKKFACEICGKQFYTQQNMRRHHRLHNDDVRNPFNCHLCSKQFRTKKYLVRHMATHDEKKYSCETCPKKFFSETEKRLHEEEIHESQSCCRFCGHVYVGADDVESHRRIHLGDKLFECTVCDERFGCTKSLHRHMTLHTGEKQHECKWCGKRFRVRCYLTKHLRGNCSSMPYMCCLCSKRYAYREDLMMHYRNCRMEGDVNAEMATNATFGPLINEMALAEVEVSAKLTNSFASV